MAIITEGNFNFLSRGSASLSASLSSPSTFTTRIPYRQNQPKKKHPRQNCHFAIHGEYNKELRVGMHPTVSRFALEDSRSPFLWSSAIVLVNITSGLTGHSTVTHCCSSGPPANLRLPHRRPRRRHPPHPDPSVASRPSIATPASAMARGVSRRWVSRPPTTEGRPQPAAGASWRHGGGGQSKEGGEVGKHERQADLHLRPSGRPAIAGGSTGQRRRRAFSLRRQ
jgi:hypothetical protein